MFEREAKMTLDKTIKEQEKLLEWLKAYKRLKESNNLDKARTEILQLANDAGHNKNTQQAIGLMKAVQVIDKYMI